MVYFFLSSPILFNVMSLSSIDLAANARILFVCLFVLREGFSV